MSTSIGRFVAEVGVDVDVASGLNRAVREVQGAVSQINRAADGIKPIDVGIGAPQVQADVAKAISALKALGAEVQLIGRNAAGAHIVQVDERQLELVSGVLKRLGVDAQIVTRAMAAVAQQTKQVAVVAQQAAVAETTLARATQTAAGSATQVGRSFALINQATGAFTPLGQRAASASVTFGFGLEALARGGAAAEGGVRTALRAIASVAAAFGPQGLIVAGAAASAAAIIDLFTSAREEAEKTRKVFEDEVAKMVRSADTIGLQQRLQEIDLGDPLAGLGKGGGFKGGRLDLVAQLDELTAAQQRAQKAGNLLGKDGVLALGRQIDDVTKKLTPLQDEWNKVVRVFKNFPTLPREITGAKPIVVDPVREFRSNAEASSKALTDLAAKIQGIISADALAGTTRAVEDLGGKAVPVYQAMTAAIAAHRGEVTESIAGLRRLAAEFEKTNAGVVAAARLQFAGGVPSLVRPTIPIKPIEVDVIPVIRPNAFTDLQTKFDSAVAAVNRDRLTIDVALSTGNRSLEDSAQATLKRDTAEVRRLGASMAEAIRAAHLPTQQETALLEDLVRKFNQAGVAAKQPSLALDTFVTIGRGVLGVADSFNKVDQDARRAASGILDAIGAVEQFNRARAASDTLGKVGGAVGIIGAAVQVGASIANFLDRDRKERQRIADEQNRVLRENTRAIEEQRAAVGGFQGSVKDFADIANALKSVPRLDLGGFKVAGGFTGTIPTDLGKNAGIRTLFDAQLKGVGTSLAETEAAARRMGITLYDQAGHVIPGAFGQLDEAIRLTIREMTEWQDTLQDSRRKQDLLNNVLNIPQTPQSIVGDWLTDIKDLAPNLFDRFFAGIDPSDGLDPGEMRRAKEGVVALTKAFLAGQISAEEFGELLGKGELGTIIEGMETGFDSLTDTVNAATEAMRNVPQWFKLAGFRFAAAAPVGIGPTSVPTPTPVPVLPAVSPALSATEASRLSGGPTSVTFSGDIVFQVPAGSDGPQIYDLWKREVARRASASSNPETRRLPSILPS